MKAKLLPEVNLLKEYFSYNPDTGELVTKKQLAQRTPEGIVVGSLHPQGYLKVSFKNSSYAVHRIAWKIQTGEEPEIIDHINHFKSDNRFNNLRSVSYQINNIHRKTARGFCILPNGTYRVSLAGSDVGYFYNESLAKQAYEKAKYDRFGI